MSSNNRIDKTGGDHAGIAELIPWYTKGTLTPSERQAVSQHLENCEICRQTLAECQTLAQTPMTVQAEWQPSPAHFNRLLAALDELEAVEKTETVAPVFEIPRKKTNKPGLMQRLTAYLSPTPGWMRWTLAAETLAIAGLIGFLVLPNMPNLRGVPSGHSFETLSNAGPSDRKVANVIRIVFAADMSVKDMSELLKAAKAQIRQGPSAVGAFTLEVEKDQVPQALATLRSGKGVRLVLLLDQSTGE